MTPDDSYDMPLDIIRLADEHGDDAVQQLAAYRSKAQMLLLAWRKGFDRGEANRDYQLENGEDLKLRSSRTSQLLAEHSLADGTRVRFDYDEGRAKDKLLVSAYEADGEALTVASTLAEQYDQMAGLLYVCAEIDRAR